MSEGILSKEGEIRVDEFGNVFHLRKELSRGGQGVVFRTKDPNLAIKQPLIRETGEVDLTSNMKRVFRGVKSLPIPKDIRVAMPLSILRDQPGYVMRLLNEMCPFDSAFYLKGDVKEKMKGTELPVWLKGLEFDRALPLLNYSRTGSTKKRLLALAGCAAVLSRLHSRGLVYCDISPNNVFVNPLTSEVWLIDADNLRFEQRNGGATAYTPRFVAPEVIQRRDSSREVSDAWSFAVMAFEILSLTHPFIGARVLDPEGFDGGWDCEEPETIDGFEDLDEKAYAGYFPFIDDEDDDSNAADKAGLPRSLVLTPMLRWMFQQTLGYGRTEPQKRTPASLWAMAMAQAHDHSLICPECKMSYYADEEVCPYCDGEKPDYVTLESGVWDLVVQEKDFVVPHRLVNPFDVQHFNDETEFRLTIDFANKTVSPVRGFADPAGIFEAKFSEVD